MIAIGTKEDCCGCGACVMKCPKQCISLHADNEGFLYPQIKITECINCGLCDKVCPIQKEYQPREPQYTIAAININDDIRSKSSSGGIFYILAEEIINKGGVVFGAKFKKNWDVIIDYTEEIKGISEFQGSKYVQAYIGKSYLECKTFLEKGRDVLYSGTPCQIAGLKSFLGKDYTNLLAIDVICHGVPSPKLWEKYINSLTQSNSITQINMRDKRNGWKNFCFSLKIKEQNSSLSWHHQDNIYMKAFLNNLSLRPSCYHCHFRSLRSGSDITLGDYWGIWNINKEMDDDRGTSLALIFSKRCYQLFTENKSCKFVNTTFRDATNYNRAISIDYSPHKKRTYLFHHLNRTNNLNRLINRCIHKSFFDTAKNKLKLLLYNQR